MTLSILKILKNWFKGSTIQESMWDAIREPLEDWGHKTVLNFEQLRKDLFASGYSVNSDGLGTLPKAVKNILDDVKNSVSPPISLTYGNLINIGFEKFTTTTTNDSLRIIGGNGQPLSLTNKAYVPIQHSNQAGRMKILELNTPLSLKISGAHWGLDGSGDLSDMILDVGIIDDRVLAGPEGELPPILVVYNRPGRDIITGGVCFTDPTLVDQDGDTIVSGSVQSGSHKIVPIGYIKGNFTDTGNIFEITEVYPGERSEGIWRTWGQITSNFSSKPADGAFVWTYYGSTIFLLYLFTSGGTSNSTSYILTLPVTGLVGFPSLCIIGPIRDNSTDLADFGKAVISSFSLILSKATTATGGFTASNEKRCNINEFFYRHIL